MTNKPYTTESGSTITWVDRETLRYSINGYFVLIWVDYEPGFFNSGRIIKMKSIIKWTSKPINSPDLITDEQKQKIINEIKQYYRIQGKRCRIE